VSSRHCVHTLQENAHRVRLPISEAARKLRAQSFVIDGEAVILRDGGMADFDALPSGKRIAEARLIASAMLVHGLTGRDTAGHRRV
jgi:hypothetical protein